MTKPRGKSKNRKHQPPVEARARRRAQLRLTDGAWGKPAKLKREDAT